jgi:serine/threonine-protein kinase HipA
LEPLSQEGYSVRARKALAGGEKRKFPHVLDLNVQDFKRFRRESADHLSISGIQEKVSLQNLRGKLQFTERDGEYILKPVPITEVDQFQEDMPANEHVTMQIAEQIFGIETAINALIYFKGGELSYVTRRFDRRNDHKLSQLDFCQLSGRTEETHGKNYKYRGSYEELGDLLKAFCPAYVIEVHKLFLLIVFNYALSNGDAHLKNFSLLESPAGDYFLTPAYDLMATSIHLPRESRLALDLFKDDFETKAFQKNGFVTGACLLELGNRFGIKRKQCVNILNLFESRRDQVEQMVMMSFLSLDTKIEYIFRFRDRLRALSIQG